MACVAPQGGGGREARGEGSQAPGQPETSAIVCDPVPDEALAHLPGDACGEFLTAQSTQLELRPLRGSSDAPARASWSGEAPASCRELACSYELVGTRLGTVVLVAQPEQPPGAAPRQQWLLGPLIPSLVTEEGVELPKPLPLWGGERILVDSTDFGPTYELELWLCGEAAALRLVAREPSADVADAPEHMRELAAEASRFTGSVACERVALPMP